VFVKQAFRIYQTRVHEIPSALEGIPKHSAVQRQKKSPYASLIATATGASAGKVAIIENLMREEVFHSTLDWQTAEQLADGARKAYEIYQAAPGYYDNWELLHLAEFRLSRLEERLEKARRRADPMKIIDLEIQVKSARDFAQAVRDQIPRLADFYKLS